MATAKVVKPKPRSKVTAKTTTKAKPAASPRQHGSTVEATASRTASAAAAIPPADPLRVPDEVFNVKETAKELPAGMVELVVSGSPRGQVEVKGRKLEEFVIQQAQRFSVKSFTVYVDGKKVSRDAASAVLDDPTRPIGKVEIVAKDSRAVGWIG